MQLQRRTLDEAIAARILSEAQAAELWQFLEARHADTPSFKPAHILYYLGGLVAVGALTLFMTLGWERFGGPVGAVGWRKQRELTRSAHVWMDRHGAADRTYRFDVIGVVIRGESVRVRHVENAFAPRL